MKKVLVMPAVAAVLLAAACNDSDRTLVGPTPGGPPSVATARVRFFNATTGMTGSGGFTTNGQFATGSALPFGQRTETCATVNSGAAAFGFGAANSGGTGLSGSAIASLANQNIAAGGTYTVVATGSASSPALFLLDDAFAGPLPPNQAAIRFVNLAPGTGTPANNFTVLKGTLGSGPTQLVEPNIVVGAPTPFAMVASGANDYTVLKGHETVVTGSAAALFLAAGGVNTAAIIPTASGGFQLINIPRC